MIDIANFVVYMILYSTHDSPSPDDTKKDEQNGGLHKTLNNDLPFRILCVLMLFIMMFKMHGLMRVFIGMGKI